MSVPSSIQSLALREASNSPADHFKVAAVVHKGKRVYCKAHNIPRKTHPNGSGDLCTCHAEVRAVMRAKRILNDDLDGLSIFIARKNQFGETKPSRPCDDCMELILQNGLTPAWT